MKIILNEEIYIKAFDIIYPKDVEITVIMYKNAKLMHHPDKQGSFTVLPSKDKYSIV
jgi:hypothetical protein